MPEYKPAKYHTDGNLHIAIHGKLMKFDPRNTQNPMVKDYVDGVGRNLDRLTDLLVNEFNIQATQIIPISYRSIVHDNTMLWCGLINNMVFEDKLFNLFYSEYSEMLDRVVNSSIDSRDSVIYRDFKTGNSIFHTAAKLRILGRVFRDIEKSIGQKITGLDEELTYILKCYRDLGRVFTNGNELTITYLEDFSGTYLTDYITTYVDDVVNSSMF